MLCRISPHTRSVSYLITVYQWQSTQMIWWYSVRASLRNIGISTERVSSVLKSWTVFGARPLNVTEWFLRNPALTLHQKMLLYANRLTYSATICEQTWHIVAALYISRAIQFSWFFVIVNEVYSGFPNALHIFRTPKPLRHRLIAYATCVNLHCWLLLYETASLQTM